MESRSERVGALKVFMILGLILFSQFSILMVIRTCFEYEGKIASFFQNDVFNARFPWIAWTVYSDVSVASLVLCFAFMLWCIFCMVFVPGKLVKGPITPMGNVPIYKDNGLRCFVLTMSVFGLYLLACKSGVVYGLHSPSIIYDIFPTLIASANVFSLVFCVLLLIKGHIAPSDYDSGSSNNLLFDFYWGMELHPRIGTIDVKVLSNCRYGLTAWALLISCFVVKAFEINKWNLNGVLISAVLQLCYLLKFYWWEAGYYSSLDITLDRAGYYICYGCLTFVPIFYTSSTLTQLSMGFPNEVESGYVFMGQTGSFLLLVLGLLCLAINYWADYQRQVVRLMNGDCNIWGKKAQVIHCKYKQTVETDATGSRAFHTSKSQQSNGRVSSSQLKTVEWKSILLRSGFWGWSRHFHYLPELGLSFCWCAASGTTHLLAFFYFFFLTALLFHRSFRDDQKCRLKYGKYWEEYCKFVPYKIIPFVY